MKLCALASLAASITSDSDAPSFPYRMFSYIEVAKRAGSCWTNPICFRRDLSFSFLMSLPATI